MNNKIDIAPFDPASANAETVAINDDIIAKLTALPDQWDYPVEIIRRNRKAGKGPFPIGPPSPRARVEQIDGPAGKIDLRIIAPENPRGVYYHVHGGGWVLGGPEEQDQRLERLADDCNLAVVSVDYRLAPEHPYPAAPDDCERAALWLIENAKSRFGVEHITIGGESAGAHLAVVTLIRLRERHGFTGFAAANLNAGCYDLALTSSVRRWGTEKLILNTHDIEMFVHHFLGENADPGDPDISPIHAGLSDMPPALFTVGSRDPLLDDSLFMSQRWAREGNHAELAVFPGGAHVFIAFPGKLAEQGFERIHGFLNAHLA